MDNKYQFCLTGMKELIMINQFLILVLRQMLFVDLKRMPTNLRWNYFYKKKTEIFRKRLLWAVNFYNVKKTITFVINL